MDVRGEERITLKTQKDAEAWKVYRKKHTNRNQIQHQIHPSRHCAHPHFTPPRHGLEELTDMFLLRQPKLIPTPSRAGASTSLVLLHVAAPQLRAFRTQRRCAAANTRAASCTRVGAASLPEHKTETPAAAHAGAGDARGTEVGFVGHLGRAEGGCCRKSWRSRGRGGIAADGGCAEGGRLPEVLLCE
jgi:hypothetical protein